MSLERRLVRVIPPLSVPTYTHRYYEQLFGVERRPTRFRDLPAFRDFVWYQVRLLNAAIARARQIGVSDPETIARLNHRLTAQDLCDLSALVIELHEHGLLTSEVASQCRAYFCTLQERLFPEA